MEKLPAFFKSRPKTTYAIILALLFWYFIWPDSHAKCIKDAARTASTSYGAAKMIEACEEPTWVDRLAYMLSARKKPSTGMIDKFLDGGNQ